MKILVLADNYVPEIAATSFRTHEHAKLWLEHGHEVTVVTCVPNWPRGQIFEGYRNRLYQEEYIDGVRVVRLWTYVAANQGFFKRTLDYLSYLLSATAFARRYPDFDVLLATSPQFFTAVAGWMVSRLRRRPWVFELRDLWPESIRAVGASGGLLIKALEQLELFLYRQADHVVALTQAFKRNLVERGIAPEKIDVVTNGVDLDQLGPARISFDARRRLGLNDDAFLVGYIGTTGMAHGLETVLDAALLCRDQRRVQFLIMGQGAMRAALEQRARELRLDNVLFADAVPHEQMPSYYGSLDVFLVHLRPDPLFRTVIPSKIFEAMAMGCPILLGVEGESSEIVAESDCGICIPSGDAPAMAGAVRQLFANQDLRSHLAEQGRRTAETLYNRRSKAEDLLDCLCRVVTAAQRDKGDAVRPAAAAPQVAASAERRKAA